MSHVTHCLAAAAAILLACATGAPSEHETSGSSDVLTPTQHLVRASMALRGVRPSLEELALVREDPAWLPAIVDHYLTTPEFGATIREMHAENLLLGVDLYSFPAGFRPVGELAGATMTDINRAATEVPLRLVEHVVMNDRPYTEVVTAEHTMSNAISSKVWGTTFDPAGAEWQPATFEDDRPTAGLLSDPWLFTRHGTTTSNRSRGRANRIATSLLCYDFLDREITVDTSSIDLSDEEAVAYAIRTNPTCVSCHQTLDPLAAYLSDYVLLFVPSAIERFPVRTYNRSFSSFLAPAEPTYFGQYGGDVADLGAMIADDPRFSLCAARRFYAYLTQIDADDVPTELAVRLNDVLIESGMNARALVRTIVLSPEFRGDLGAPGDTSSPALHRARPAAFARLVEDLTGYRWISARESTGGEPVGEVDLMTDAWFGFEVLAGGTDDYIVTRPSHSSTATMALVLRELAARAAVHVVDGDLATTDPSRRRLLRRVEAHDSDHERVTLQIAALHERFYGEVVDPDDPSVAAAWDVFEAAYLETDSVRRAWIATIAAMLQDIRIVYY